MKKKVGIVLSITGVLLVTIAVLILFVIPVHKYKPIKDNKDVTEVTQGTKNEMEINDATEQHKHETTQNLEINDSNNRIQEITKQSAHEINPQVYKWPCGSKYYQDWEEPKKIIEFAKYKEYYEQIAQQFLGYEGKNVDFYVTDDMLHFDECANEGSVKVSYDKELMLDLFEKSKINAINVYNDYIIFYKDVNDRERIMYLYDENLTYNDSFPSEKDDLISGYWMVNIAPHWWWENNSDKGM